MPIFMNESQFYELTRESCGICVGCLHVAYGGCEPDAEKYECENCNLPKVYGVEQLALMNLIAFHAGEKHPWATKRNKKTNEVTEHPLIF